MTEKVVSRVDPKLIQPGTDVEVDSYFGAPFPKGERLLFQCHHPIGPKNNTEFTPSKFLLVPPPESGQQVMVFSIEDIKYARFPYYTDLERVPARPYFPISVLETQLKRSRRNLEVCEWARAVTIASTHKLTEIKDPLQMELYRQLRGSFKEGDHKIGRRPNSESDLIFTFMDLIWMKLFG